MDDLQRPVSGHFIVRAFKILSQVFSDFILGGLGYFNNTGVPPLALLGLIIGIIRLNRRLRKSKLVFIMYWIGIILSLDFIFALAYGAAASYGIIVIIILALLYLALLIIRRIWKWPSFMTRLQLFVVPVVLLGVIIKSGELWNPANRCSQINSVPGVRLLTDRKYNFTQVPHTAIPRFFVPRPKRNDILVCDHVYVYEKDILVKQSINRLDLKTGALTNWFKRGNVLDIKEDPDSGFIYAVVQKNFRDPKAPNVELIKFSPDGAVLDRKNLGLSRNTFYGASITILPDKLFITVESNFFSYLKKDGKLEKFDIIGNIGTPIYRTEWVKPYLFGTTSVTPLFGRFLGSRHLLKMNLDTKILEDWLSDYPVGIFDVERRPGKDQLAASRNLTSGAWLMDFNLNKIKKLVVPAGVREIEFSKDGKYLFATGFFDGTFYVIDPDKNKILAEVFIGNGSRGMTVSDDGTVIVGASCGVVGVDVGKFLKGRRTNQE
ncbi:MAG: hypothetical protein WCX65_09875 [bacterium]